jgi:hypothetical protein
MRAAFILVSMHQASFVGFLLHRTSKWCSSLLDMNIQPCIFRTCFLASCDSTIVNGISHSRIYVRIESFLTFVKEKEEDVIQVEEEGN